MTATKLEQLEQFEHPSVGAVALTGEHVAHEAGIDSTKAEAHLGGPGANPLHAYTSSSQLVVANTMQEAAKQLDQAAATRTTPRATTGC